MKFTILALLGATQASQIVIPDIEWNQAAVDKVEKNLQAGLNKVAEGDKKDFQESLNDLSMAYSRYRVGEIVSFGKNMKPIAEMNVELLDDLTVTGNCNRESATTCVNDYLWQRTTKP